MRKDIEFLSMELLSQTLAEMMTSGDVEGYQKLATVLRERRSAYERRVAFARLALGTFTEYQKLVGLDEAASKFSWHEKHELFAEYWEAAVAGAEQVRGTMAAS